MSGQVQETNDFSIASKYSMVSRGYFEDDYMQYLSPKLKRRSPLINIGYYVRAVVVNEGVQLYLNSMPGIDCQIVSLGAGFDTTFFRLVHAHENVKYFEIDFREVVERKISNIKNSEFVYKKLINPQECTYGLTSENYSIICQDMGQVSELESVLASSGFDTSKPTLFLSECAMTYMPEESSTKLIRWASKLNHAVFMIYEQINPDDGFGRVMMNHFNSIDSPLKSVTVYKTKEDQINRYISCGFDKSISIGAFEIYLKALAQKEHDRVLNLEPFDEWEEWHLTSCHYTLSVGVKGLFEKMMSCWFSRYSSTVSDVSLCEPTLSLNVSETTKLKLYAHSVLKIWNGEAVLIIGGYGLSDVRQHKRIDQIHLLYLENEKIAKLTPPKIDGITWDCMYHTCSLVTDSEREATLLLFGGRTSPVNHVNCPGFVLVFKKEEEQDGVHIRGRKVSSDSIVPEPRRRHAAVPLSCGRVFMCGGLSSQNKTSLKVLGDCWLFTCDQNWIKLESDLPPRFSHSAVSYEGSVFIVGGIDQVFAPLNDVWSYDVSGNVWTQYDFNILPRYSHISHCFEDFMIIVGGVNHLSEKQPGMCVIDLKDKVAKEYKLPESSNETAPIMLHNHSSVISSDSKKIYVIGGGGNCFSFGTAFNESVISLQLTSLLPQCQNR